MITNIYALIIVLGVLIFFHELGHFLVARLFGVGVEKFSLGFGPRLFGWKVGITDYRISAIPLGGYVKMVGEEPDSEIEPEQIPLSFTHKHVLKRIAIVAAGPVFNFFLAVMIFFAFFQIHGVFILKPYVGSAVENMPAQKAGLKKGDLIVAIDQTPIEFWDDMVYKINSSDGRELVITVLRDGTENIYNIKPKLSFEKYFGIEVKRYQIGIRADGDKGYEKKLNPIQAFSEGFLFSFKMIKLTVIGTMRIINGTESAKSVGGPILIAQMAGDAAKKGPGVLIRFIGYLSLVLAFFNILPIPVLDGGHLLFFFIELVTGRPANLKVREIAQTAGLFILILLMVFVFYNDITRVLFN